MNSYELSKVSSHSAKTVMSPAGNLSVEICYAPDLSRDRMLVFLSRALAALAAVEREIQDMPATEAAMEANQVRTCTSYLESIVCK